MNYAFSIATSLLALATTTFAVPAATSTGTGTSTSLARGTAIGGAGSYPTAESILEADYATPPEHLTIVIINKHGDKITTSMDTDPSAPTAISGKTGTGTMTEGETASVVVPTGWIGNWAINDGHYEITTDDTLLEANFVTIGDVAVASVDVSYVDGFSVAMTCSCDDVVVTGCNLNLFDLHTCGDNDGENACVNPNRANTKTTTATPFFRPCAGAAYTFPNDSGADSTGECQNGVIRCCVGHVCPENPKQPVS